jgi:hypothetical protein
MGRAVMNAQVLARIMKSGQVRFRQRNKLRSNALTSEHEYRFLPVELRCSEHEKHSCAETLQLDAAGGRELYQRRSVDRVCRSDSTQE